MPKLEPKQIQKELENGRIWPIYWIYGNERMKSRELLARIKKAVLGAQSAAFGEEVLDAAEVSSVEVLDAARNLAFGGGPKLIVVRDAHLLKDVEPLAELLGPATTQDQLASVCVFLSKDLDGRKKFSKLLVDKAAVVPCEEVVDEERESWIGYLSKRRGLTLAPGVVAQLRSLDPWSLDIIDQELEKYSLASGDPERDPSSVLLGNFGATGGADVFLNAFFNRELKSALECTEGFAGSPDEALPLLGLLAWNVRHLALVVGDREKGTRDAKLNPYLAERFRAWSRKWSLKEMTQLEQALAELDFGTKQTPKVPVGLWASLVHTFCRA